MYSALVAASSLLIAQTYGDELDILRGADTTPQIALVLDVSCSMGASYGLSPTTCTFFATSAPSGHGASRNTAQPQLSRLEMLKATLTGCQNDNDGIIDQWSQRVAFGMWLFGSNDGAQWRMAHQFDWDRNSGGTLESTTRAMTEFGGTPMVRGYIEGARAFGSFFNDTNSEQCRQNYIILMTDGEGNGTPDTTVNLRSAQGEPAITVADFTYNSDPDRNGVGLARYLYDGGDADLIPGLAGNQPIRTYTIGFQVPSTAALLNLEQIATAGDGLFYPATNYQALDTAFREIILSIAARTAVTFSPATVQNDGLFSGNALYATSFRPFDEGYWQGTTRKHCVIPANRLDDTCSFIYGPNDVLLTNDRPLDVWTAASGFPATVTRSQVANVGGAGQLVFYNYFNNTVDPVGAAIPNPVYQRNIVTWRPGTAAYVDLESLSAADTWTSGPCEHWSIINKLFGYTAEANCTGAEPYRPLALSLWPTGDTIHGSTVLLKYSNACETGGDNCFVFTTANDGMLHVYNAVTGREVSAVVPGHFLRPSNVTHSVLADVLDQPNFDSLRRYYFDGPARLYHDDLNANGYVDESETAYLVAGLGRGGKAYIQWNVSAIAGNATFNGTFDAGRNPPRVLMVDETSPFRNLQDTWAAPWFGRFRHSDGSLRRAAVFPSGHAREFDQPSAPFAATISAPQGQLADSEANPQSRGCSQFGLPEMFCAVHEVPCLSLGRPRSDCAGLDWSSGCVPCTRSLGSSNALTCPGGGVPTNIALYLGLLGYSIPAVGSSSQVYCYDWPGWRSLAAGSGFYTATGIDTNRQGPFRWSAANFEGAAYRVIFSRFNLQDGDELVIFDQDQNVVDRITRANSTAAEHQCGGQVCTRWVYDQAFYLQWTSDGVNSQTSTGFNISEVQYLRRAVQPASVTIRPNVYVVDLDRWNGVGNTAAQQFSAQPGASDNRQADALLARFTNQCDGLPGANCYDSTTFPILGAMTCPISAEPSIYTEGGILRTIYVGDECGQIWAFEQLAANTWDVRRLLHANNVSGINTVAGRQSKDYRKIFRKLELVLSNCTGSRGVGVYFGTGDIQRPAQNNALQDASVTDFDGNAFRTNADVIGVVWDSAVTAAEARLGQIGLEDLVRVSGTGAVDSRSGAGQYGYLIPLFRDPGLVVGGRGGEKMLRDPLVFDGVAYFKTYQMTTPATECVSASGQETIYVFDNCTAAPLPGVVNSTGFSTRVASSETSDIGGNLNLFTPATGRPFVSAMTPGQGPLPGRPTSRGLKLYMWRPSLELN